ncbi:hypothetical protein [Actinacidiphila yeochonensis]|uniref:hypothetical protein n=1 Tax=Actinacidiphila yeochonensis TaxID=89050 RepID=UPI000690A433|nr:hypothetical protein [Actinacidiphila yeochonensis]
MHGGRGDAVASELGWVLIRQDEGGNRYRVGRYATRAEAERVVGVLGFRAVGAEHPLEASGAPGAGGAGTEEPRPYLIERWVPRPAQD